MKSNNVHQCLLSKVVSQKSLKVTFLKGMMAGTFEEGGVVIGYFEGLSERVLSRKRTKEQIVREIIEERRSQETGKKPPLPRDKRPHVCILFWDWFAEDVGTLWVPVKNLLPLHRT
ncbi:MAG: hypothetical protein RI935_206 [Candidatus Parcubacteria bacterium]|jgi:hypothetical protein